MSVEQTNPPFAKSEILILFASAVVMLGLPFLATHCGPAHRSAKAPQTRLTKSIKPSVK